MTDNLAGRCCFDCGLFKWDVFNLGDYQICSDCIDVRIANDPGKLQQAVQQQAGLPKPISVVSDT